MVPTIEKQPPLCLALLVCDSITRDPTTGKMNLLGTFGGIVSKSYPATHPQLAVFIELTNGHGETSLELKLVKVLPRSVDTVDDIIGEPVQQWSMNVTFPDPIAMFQIALGVTNVVLPEAGEYRFILECQGVFLMERRLIAAMPPER